MGLALPKQGLWVDIQAYSKFLQESYEVCFFSFSGPLGHLLRQLLGRTEVNVAGKIRARFKL